MKMRKLVFRLFFFLLSGALFISSCKKDNSSSNKDPLSAGQTIQVQNSDAQDAIAEKTEEDIDNKIDELENNNYSIVTGKSMLIDLTDTLVITVDHPDTVTFPKVITFHYYNYKDSCANETIIKDGTITITVKSSNPDIKRLVSREFVFNNFAVTTDSTIVIINGTRTVDRQNASLKLTGLLYARISVADNIYDTLKFDIVTTRETDTLHFTRNTNKVRTAIAHFKNVLYDPLHPLLIYYKHVPSADSLTYTGTVTGINENEDEYSKTITEQLVITVYQGSLVITSGEMTYTVGSDTYDITFQADPDHKHLTLVTVTNTATGESVSFDRYFGRKYRKWWVED
jgi:hypothetical protein